MTEQLMSIIWIGLEMTAFVQASMKLRHEDVSSFQRVLCTELGPEDVSLLEVSLRRILCLLKCLSVHSDLSVLIVSMLD